MPADAHGSTAAAGASAATRRVKKRGAVVDADRDLHRYLADAGTDLDRDACYRALQTRDARFDGRFYTAVTSTGIYCRPICPARTPKIENCLFLPSAGAAYQLGYRPCLRCRPEAAPGMAQWKGSASTVARALHLIAEGALDDAGVDALADRLGVGARHLRRLFDRYLGASPVSVSQAHRVLFAKKLIDETSLSITDVALASGFGSIRRFNDAFRTTYARTPSTMRRSRGAASARSAAAGAVGVVLKLPFSPPYDWRAMLDFLATRAIPGVEAVQGGCYRRTFALDDARGIVEVRAAADENYLLATIHTNRLASLAAVVSRVRGVFDLDADIAAIDAHLSRDPVFAARVRERPGIRVPGAWDAFELAVRAVLGQQISVRAATTFAGRLAAMFGEPLHENAPGGADEPHPPRTTRTVVDAPGPHLIFPTPAAIAEADMSRIALTRARAAALRSLVGAMARDPRMLCRDEALDETIRKLCTLPGIGPWTAQYIAMRALREPDAFPATDLGLLRAMQTADGRPSPAALTQAAEAWRPWRAYAALRLWIQASGN